MSSVAVDTSMTRWIWKGGASHIYFGSCATCGRDRTADDHPLLVARQERSRRGFECLECFTARTRPRRRRRRQAA